MAHKEFPATHHSKSRLQKEDHATKAAAREREATVLRSTKPSLHTGDRHIKALSESPGFLEIACIA
jgi:hypothetical protein